MVPQGARAASLPLGGFSIFWLGFVAFWTFSAVAMGAPIIFPLFSIPFWCVGLYLLYRTLNGVFGRTEVELAAGELTVDRRLFWLSRRMTVPLAEVGPCRIAAAAAAAGSGQAQGPPQTACLLDAGAVRVSLAGSLSDREKEWLRDTINAHLDAHRPRR